ncbi:hypothetical protein MTBBW1_1990007 [Desulfamplus magnetovallimortis]|uniref:Uncharacterized protein n=1 Tax=Desulfamplus magnetovallimortis TaxID=1246637 RepID=A0A1W1HBD2_9BACT|nr:hypothetical protein [Desulfamplus magnetovallimortis]SLM29804.1 hypothetical protein MTBBW1_1990007 [Desulfamplus magnetovallimortis]
MSDLFEYQEDKIWLKEYPIKYAGTRFNARTTVVRMNNGNLKLY